MPFVMKVLEPLITYSSPSRRAVVRSALRSLPACGSVSANAPMSSPVTILGNQRCFCSSVPRASMYADTMSVWVWIVKLAWPV